jgi:hypothetical protein
MLDMVHCKKFPFTELQGNYRVKSSISGIPIMNQTHKPNLQSLLISIVKSVRGSIVSTITRIYARDLRFKSWQKQENYPFSKTYQPPQAMPSLKLNVQQTLFSGSKEARADRLTTHI